MQVVAEGGVVGEELAQERRVAEVGTRDRHRAAIHLEEVVAAAAVGVFDAEDLVGSDVDAVLFPAPAHPSLPHERGRLALYPLVRILQDLVGLDDPNVAALPAGSLECDHEVGHRERVLEEQAGRVGVAAPGVLACLLGKQALAAAGEAVYHRLRAATALMVVDLGARPIDVAVVVKLVQPAEDLCRRLLRHERLKVRRAHEPVPGGRLEDHDVAVGDHEPRRALAFEPCSSFWLLHIR